MGRFWAIIMCSLLLAGCGQQGSRMDHPDDPSGPYADQIAVARKVLQQNEDWAERAEWEVTKTDDGWRIIAWRVEHPDRTGSDRYLPWGYSVIELDHRNIAVHYQRKG